MPITVFSGNDSIRSQVVEYLEQRKQKDRPYKVIDIGGAANPWCDDLVNAYVDINPIETKKPVFRGNILEPDVWKALRKEKWDFSICTHVLEDIRSPWYVVKNLLSISSAGFIATPNKHTEFSHVESPFWVGYCHHRWIFTINSGKLLAIAKFPIVNYFSKRNFILHWAGKSPLFSRMQKRLGLIPGGRGLGWLDTSRVFVKNGPMKELGFIWESSFEFEFINDDYAGHSVHELADLYRVDLRKGV